MKRPDVEAWRKSTCEIRKLAPALYREEHKSLSDACDYITALEAENARQAKYLDQMLVAIESGQVTSAEIDLGPDIGPPASFHEMWASYVRSFLSRKEQGNG